jgi:hypothetical protein
VGGFGFAGVVQELVALAGGADGHDLQHVRESGTLGRGAQGALMVGERGARLGGVAGPDSGDHAGVAAHHQPAGCEQVGDAKQVTKPIRNREARVTEPQLE